MDSITHTFFGLALYGTVDKSGMDKKRRLAYLMTAVGASQIPDIDIISKVWDQEGLYQMWHRGITHSIFMTPVWALLFAALAAVFFRVREKRLFFLAWLAVLIHSTSDLFNAWGTGYLEPFSDIRLTFGTVPIIDLVIWTILGTAFFLARKKPKEKAPVYYKSAWLFIGLHILIQSIQGGMLYHQYKESDNQIALSAGFIPWTYSVIVKQEATVEIFEDGLLLPKKRQYVLHSNENADLDSLFKKRPEAKTLYDWSPFVVIVDDNKRIGVYDPRFYRNGQSFLFEYIEKKTH